MSYNVKMCCGSPSYKSLMLTARIIPERVPLMRRSLSQPVLLCSWCPPKTLRRITNPRRQLCQEHGKGCHLVFQLKGSIGSMNPDVSCQN